ncbi:unnamed protein product [Anisakis simplex]|uniref:Uncharacterized protein n=1 Tax=Anisakis simplex TaxID=6269 RepID=A0A0M3K605_ANISI|nr:unnamed protein product [Anisakis simplex]
MAGGRSRQEPCGEGYNLSLISILSGDVDISVLVDCTIETLMIKLLITVKIDPEMERNISGCLSLLYQISHPHNKIIRRTIKGKQDVTGHCRDLQHNGADNGNEIDSKDLT